MRCRYFEIELKSEVFIGRPGTLTGGYDGKDYLPGQVFLGVAAARLYKQLDEDEAWTVFHSGAVRFGDGLPLTDKGLMTWPVPRCWQHEKGTEVKGNVEVQDTKIYNAIHIQASRPKKLKEGYISVDGTWCKPVTRLRMKTAIDPRTGRPAEGRLFGYTGISRGTRYLMSLEAEDSLSEQLFERIVQTLVGECYVGRSRTAEYGRVLVKTCANPPIPDFSCTDQTRPEKRLVLWLLSDLAVEDDLGQPVCSSSLKAEWLGLKPGELNSSLSALSWGNLAPYNAHLRGHEQERYFIQRGSVLVFDMEQDCSELVGFDSLGLHRQSGLGRVWLNPALLQTLHPNLKDPAPENKTPSTSQSFPPPALATWLQARSQKARDEDLIAERAAHWADIIRGAYQSARGLAAAGADERVGPSKHQWGRIREAARQGINRQQDSYKELEKMLFDIKDGICKADDPDWGQSILEFTGWPEPISKGQNPKQDKGGNPSASDLHIREKPTFRELIATLLKLEKEALTKVNRTERLLAKILARTARHAIDLAEEQAPGEARK